MSIKKRETIWTLIILITAIVGGVAIGLLGQPASAGRDCCGDVIVLERAIRKAHAELRLAPLAWSDHAQEYGFRESSVKRAIAELEKGARVAGFELGERRDK